MMELSDEQPLVSVAMVTRSVERFLPEAIESILNQTLRNLEFIVVDFGSTDNSKEIIAGYAAADHRIRFVQIEQCGLAAARNAACALAKGRYIAIQDADDISLPERLALEVELMERLPEVGLVGSAIQRIDENGKCLQTVNDFPTEDHDIRREMETWNPFWQPTVLMLREAFVKLGGYRETLSEDYDLWIRISEHYRCANLSQVLVKYRIHNHQLSVRRRKQQILSMLAAQASASLRRQGKPDLLNSVKELTPAFLTEMGIDEKSQMTSIAAAYAFWVRQLYSTGEYKSVCAAADQMCDECEMKGFSPRQLSDVYLLAARAHWKQGNTMKFLFAILQALRVRPLVIGRPLKLLLHRPRIAN